MRRNEVGILSHESAMEDADDLIRRVVSDSRAKAPRAPCFGRTLGEEDVLSIHQRDDRFVDDLTGLPLPPELCKAARQKEIDYFKSKGVWEIRSINEARQRMGRGPISVRWVETNKGDDVNPNIRSRLVAREIRTSGQEAIFAPAPPLESLRMVLSYAATELTGTACPAPVRDDTSGERMQISLIDISRAYFNARTKDEEPIYVQFPAEFPAPAGSCGLLRRHMYGTRRAAEGWQDEYSSSLTAMGFVQGAASPCVFVHLKRNIVVSVHGDDFTAAGPKSSLDWYETEMRKKYELTVGGRLGPAATDDKEATVLNRVIRWTPEGIEYEADPRQVERLLEELNLEGDGVKGVVTPGVKTTAQQLSTEEELPERQHTWFRGVAARANYLSADRPDIMYAAKEICRLMSKPTDVAVTALKRLGRYLRARPRLVFKLPFQKADSWDVFTDTDWAGCIRTRKSTSGGCLMLGRHVVKFWSATQASLALSSGEAEYYGVVRGAGIGLGQKALGKDAGFDLPLRVWTDSSAAMGTAARQGLGKLRHLECHSLWLQQRLRRREFSLRKVDGTENPADLFTKHMDSSIKLSKLVEMYGCEFREGRAAAAPELKKAQVVEAAREPVCLLSGGTGRSKDALPHLMPSEQIDYAYPPAVPDAEVIEGEDQSPHKELADPVPLLRPRTHTKKLKTVLESKLLSTVSRIPRGRPRMTTEERDSTRSCNVIEEARDVAEQTAHRHDTHRRASAVGECERLGTVMNLIVNQNGEEVAEYDFVQYNARCEYAGGHDSSDRPAEGPRHHVPIVSSGGKCQQQYQPPRGIRPVAAEAAAGTDRRAGAYPAGDLTRRRSCYLRGPSAVLQDCCAGYSASCIPLRPGRPGDLTHRQCRRWGPLPLIDNKKDSGDLTQGHCCRHWGPTREYVDGTGFVRPVNRRALRPLGRDCDWEQWQLGKRVSDGTRAYTNRHFLRSIVPLR